MDINNTNGAARRMLKNMARGERATFTGEGYEISGEGWSMYVVRDDMRFFEDEGHVVLEIDNELVLTPKGRNLVKQL